LIVNFNPPVLNEFKLLTLSFAISNSDQLISSELSKLHIRALWPIQPQAPQRQDLFS
ncbi:5438_t:CDS:1, partial [Dentiscutata erythropus]